MSEESTAVGGPHLLRAHSVEIARGDLLAGRYQIERVVGKGGTGSVLRAFDRVVRQVVAVKVLNSELAADTKWVDRLGDELRHARKLNHPNVCRVFDLSEADGHRFLTMEFAGGGSLRDRLTAAGAKRPIAERIADARSIIEGLAAIHAAGIIHRDVKPENVLCMDDGRLVVSDFGLAVTPGQDGATFYSAIVGTPSYMAPEVVMGDKATMAADVWALGIVLHELLFARRPAWENSSRGRAFKSPVDRNSTTIERTLARVCELCLDFLPADRPMHALDVKRLFEQAAIGRRARRKPLAVKPALMTSAALAGLVLGGVGVWELTRGERVVVPEELKLTGDAPAVQAGRVLRTFEGMASCLEPLPDGRLRVYADDARKTLVIDPKTGASEEVQLPSGKFKSCPRISPDERSMLLTMNEEGSARPSIWLYEQGGAAPKRIVEGADPHWLPNGREFLVSFNSTLAASDLKGELDFLPNPLNVSQRVLDVAVSRDGKEATILLDAAAKGRYAGVVALPSHSFKRLVKVPTETVGLSTGPSSPGDLVITEGGKMTVASLQGGEALRRLQIDAIAAKSVTATEAGVAFLRLKRETTLKLSEPGKPDRDIHRGDLIGRTSTASDGTILVERLPNDGRQVIAVAFPDQTGLVDLSSGPSDSWPSIASDGQSFSYVRAERKEIVRCDLSRDGASGCAVVPIQTGETWPSDIRLSPRGKRIAYLARSGSIRRIVVVNASGGEALDLGPATGRCFAFWSTEDTVWIRETAASGDRWSEISIPSRHLTGRREEIGNASGCQPPRGLQGKVASVKGLTRTELVLIGP